MIRGPTVYMMCTIELNVFRKQSRLIEKEEASETEEKQTDIQIHCDSAED
jgi:hypothetical protein